MKFEGKIQEKKQSSKVSINFPIFFIFIQIKKINFLQIFYF